MNRELNVRPLVSGLPLSLPSQPGDRDGCVLPLGYEGSCEGLYLEPMPHQFYLQGFSVGNVQYWGLTLCCQGGAGLKKISRCVFLNESCPILRQRGKWTLWPFAPVTIPLRFNDSSMISSNACL